MSGLWARYNKLLEAQPLLTKALTSLTGFTLGDILAQKFVESSDKPYDLMRTVRLGSFGFLIHGTTGHYFYGFLDGKLPGTAPLTVATKVAIDQTIWNPIFGCMFFGYLNLVEGKSWDEYVNKLKADLKTAVMGSWAVWVPAHVSLKSLSSLHVLTSIAPCRFSFSDTLTYQRTFSSTTPRPSISPLFPLVSVCSTLTRFKLDTTSFCPFWVTSPWSKNRPRRNKRATTQKATKFTV